MARQRGWRIELRIEDLDGPRVKPDAASQAIDLLAWLGIDWDSGPVVQSHDLTPYHAALRRLAEQGDAYPCRCTRTQILAAALSAPQEGEPELRYPNTCRPAEAAPLEFSPSPDTAWRMRVPDAALRFEDCFAGPFEQNLQSSVGDYLIATKGGAPSYQLAVVVDDARQGIDRIVRGDDLLSSTLRQQWLRRRLGIADEPQHWHLPLVVGEDGRRLAKRHGDTRVSFYREHGVLATRVLGLIAEWCGLGPRGPISAAELLDRFDIARVPKTRIVFSQSDDAWLRG